jgi:hypothetical protein
MTKILKIESLGNNRFEVAFSQNGNEQKRVVKYDTHRISTDLVMPLLTPKDTNDRAFFDLLGVEKSFRVELIKRIETAAEKQGREKHPKAA